MPRLLLVVLLLPVVIACSGDSQDTADVSSDDVLAAATRAVRDLKSFHFELKHENGASPLPLNLRLVSAEGDVQIPDRLTTKVQAKAGSVNVSVEAIAVGESVWITNPFSREWQALRGARLSDLISPAALIELATQRLEEVRVVSIESAGGRKGVRLAGKLDTVTLASVLSAAEPGRRVDVDVWIDRETSYPLRIKISGPLNRDESDNIVRQIDLSRFNQPLDIRPPR